MIGLRKSLQLAKNKLVSGESIVQLMKSPIVKEHKEIIFIESMYTCIIFKKITVLCGCVCREVSWCVWISRVRLSVCPHPIWQKHLSLQKVMSAAPDRMVMFHVYFLPPSELLPASPNEKKYGEEMEIISLPLGTHLDSAVLWERLLRVFRQSERGGENDGEMEEEETIITAITFLASRFFWSCSREDTVRWQPVTRRVVIRVSGWPGWLCHNINS